MQLFHISCISVILSFRALHKSKHFHVTEKIAVIFQPELIHWKKRVCCQVQLRMLASGFFQKDKGCGIVYENCEARNHMKKQKCKDCSLISLLYFLNKQIGIQQPTFCWLGFWEKNPYILRISRSQVQLTRLFVRIINTGNAFRNVRETNFKKDFPRDKKNLENLHQVF